MQNIVKSIRCAYFINARYILKRSCHSTVGDEKVVKKAESQVRVRFAPSPTGKTM